ncbi:hypothetical protein HDU98_008440 [Podochytrium sp. JEL0797]|nr:hypothetical protein HDU98_008440 [Podochytrium sp. JEL0797]
MESLPALKAQVDFLPPLGERPASFDLATEVSSSNLILAVLFLLRLLKVAMRRMYSALLYALCLLWDCVVACVLNLIVSARAKELVSGSTKSAPATPAPTTPAPTTPAQSHISTTTPSQKPYENNTRQKVQYFESLAKVPARPPLSQNTGRAMPNSKNDPLRPKSATPVKSIVALPPASRTAKKSTTTTTTTTAPRPSPVAPVDILPRVAREYMASMKPGRPAWNSPGNSKPILDKQPVQKRATAPNPHTVTAAPSSVLPNQPVASLQNSAGSAPSPARISIVEQRHTPFIAPSTSTTTATTTRPAWRGLNERVSVTTTIPTPKLAARRAAPAPASATMAEAIPIPPLLPPNYIAPRLFKASVPTATSQRHSTQSAKMAPTNSTVGENSVSLPPTKSPASASPKAANTKVAIAEPSPPKVATTPTETHATSSPKTTFTKVSHAGLPPPKVATTPTKKYPTAQTKAAVPKARAIATKQSPTAPPKTAWVKVANATTPPSTATAAPTVTSRYNASTAPVRAPVSFPNTASPQSNSMPLKDSPVSSRATKLSVSSPSETVILKVSRATHVPPKVGTIQNKPSPSAPSKTAVAKAPRTPPSPTVTTTPVQRKLNISGPEKDGAISPFSTTSWLASSPSLSPNLSPSYTSRVRTAAEQNLEAEFVVDLSVVVKTLVVMEVESPPRAAATPTRAAFAAQSPQPRRVSPVNSTHSPPQLPSGPTSPALKLSKVPPQPPVKLVALTKAVPSPSHIPSSEAPPSVTASKTFSEIPLNCTQPISKSPPATKQAMKAVSPNNALAHPISSTPKSPLKSVSPKRYHVNNLSSTPSPLNREFSTKPRLAIEPHSTASKLSSPSSSENTAKSATHAASTNPLFHRPSSQVVVRPPARPIAPAKSTLSQPHLPSSPNSRSPKITSPLSNAAIAPVSGTASKLSRPSSSKKAAESREILVPRRNKNRCSGGVQVPAPARQGEISSEPAPVQTLITRKVLGDGKPAPVTRPGASVSEKFAASRSSKLSSPPEVPPRLQQDENFPAPQRVEPSLSVLHSAMNEFETQLAERMAAMAMEIDDDLMDAQIKPTVALTAALQPETLGIGASTKMEIDEGALDGKTVHPPPTVAFQQLSPVPLIADSAPLAPFYRPEIFPPSATHEDEDDDDEVMKEILDAVKDVLLPPPRPSPDIVPRIISPLHAPPSNADNDHVPAKPTESRKILVPRRCKKGANIGMQIPTPARPPPTNPSESVPTARVSKPASMSGNSSAPVQQPTPMPSHSSSPLLVPAVAPSSKRGASKCSPHMVSPSKTAPSPNTGATIRTPAPSMRRQEPSTPPTFNLVLPGQVPLSFVASEIPATDASLLDLLEDLQRQDTAMIDAVTTQVSGGMGTEATDALSGIPQPPLFPNFLSHIGVNDTELLGIWSSSSQAVGPSVSAAEVDAYLNDPLGFFTMEQQLQAPVADSENLLADFNFDDFLQGHAGTSQEEVDFLHAFLDATLKEQQQSGGGFLDLLNAGVAPQNLESAPPPLSTRQPLNEFDAESVGSESKVSPTH